MANILHLFITRFLVITKVWERFWKKKNKDPYHIFSDKIVIPRIKSFVRYYLPWVRNQTNKNFYVYIIVDKELSMKYIDMIKEHISEFDNIYIIRYQPERVNLCNYFLEKNCMEMNDDINDFSKIKEKLGVDVEDAWDMHKLKHIDYVITTRIDDDDIISTNFVEYVQSRCDDVDSDFRVIGFNNGYALENNTIYTFKKKYKAPYLGSQSVGLTVIHNNQNTNIKKQFNILFTPHNNWPRGLRRISDDMLYSPKTYDKKEYRETNATHKIFIYNRNLSTSDGSVKTKQLNRNEKNAIKQHFPHL